MIATLLIAIMELIRPVLGFYGCCPFAVSCMAFAKIQLTTLPLYKAIFFITLRLIKCSPLSYFIKFNFLDN